MPGTQEGKNDGQSPEWQERWPEIQEAGKPGGKERWSGTQSGKNDGQEARRERTMEGTQEAENGSQKLRRERTMIRNLGGKERWSKTGEGKNDESAEL
ncbi:hypothetical protein V501_08262 [Pseudogymnoascus sp. VKM F-4519 (FW-2642)]|nr:hypothetical protein V501_08262 [Pseudogymnoascus sp. VKM F-4519 (FW-2642)]